MSTLRERLNGQSEFLLGLELVTTRGTIANDQAVRTRSFATQLVHSHRVDWVSITDNAGGNPQLSPMALGKPILYAGKEVVIHLSCKDMNRHGLESEAWQLASEGFHNILALSGDYPAAGYGGQAKPVFDIDSIGLLAMLEEMNRGFLRPKIGGKNQSESIGRTDFFVGAVATNFKRHENEVVPQLLKLKKKVECGAKFIIAQIGFDSRKSHEMICYIRNQGMKGTPLIGNVFLLSGSKVRFFRKQTIPGVVISNELNELCERHARSPDRGAAYFTELAAKQLAIFRGLRFAGGYLGGVHSIEQLHAILDKEQSFAEEDWKQFVREIRYPVPDEFYLYAEDTATGLAVEPQHGPAYDVLRHQHTPSRHVTLSYRFSKLVHDRVFTPGHRWYRWAKSFYTKAPDPKQGPKLLRIVEHLSKSVMFGCKDCGDCSLPDIAFLCPESQCAKNQRNGPCGGTRDGQCEVDDIPCIWSRAYDRLKHEGREQDLLNHAPVIQDESLRGTSSWANALFGRDHAAKHPNKTAVAGEKPVDSVTLPSESELQTNASIPANATTESPVSR